MRLIIAPLAYLIFTISCTQSGRKSHENDGNTGAPTPISVVDSLPANSLLGEWIILEKTLMTTSLNLFENGTGQLVDTLGSSAVTWVADGEKLKIELLTPTFSTETDISGDRIIVAKRNLTLRYNQSDKLLSFARSMEISISRSFPDNPGKAPEIVSSTSDSIQVLAGSSLKPFVPQQNEVRGLTLPGYSGEEFLEDLSVLLRFDAEGVATILEDHPSGIASLLWTLKDGTLQVSDGKGYTVSYRQYLSTDVSKRLLADRSSKDLRYLADEKSLLVDDKVRAQGFHSQSQIFQGCWEEKWQEKWEMFVTTYCFQPDRLWSVSSPMPDGMSFLTTGLWHFEGKKIAINQYKETGTGRTIEDLPALLACEKELADDTIQDKSCELRRYRTYELLNQNSTSIALYRIINYPGYDLINHYPEVLTRSVP